MAPRRSSVQHHQQPQQPQPLQQHHPHHQTQLQEHESLHHHQQQLQLQQHQQLLTTTASTFYNHNDDDENNSNIIIISNNDSNRSNLLSSNNIMSPMQTSNSTNNHQSNNNHKNEQFTRCCYPNGECFKVDTVITFDDFSDCVRVICNNENCNVGQYMHRECFESWEQTVQVYLKSTGRARSWSDRQRSQNLWTKKGYDLVYKACGCKCGRGHIRKDLEWTPTPVSVTVLKNGGGGTATTNGVNGGNFSNGTAVITTNGANTNGGQQRLVNGNGGSSSSNGGSVNVNPNDEEDKKKKKKRNRNNQKPALALAPLNPNGYHTNSQQLQQQQQQQQQQQSQQQQQQNGHTTNGIAVVSNGNANSVSNGITNNCSQIVVSSNNANVANNSSNNNNISPNPNVGVIGSGLHHNSNSLQQQQQQLAPQAQQQQQQQQQQQSVVPSLSNIMSNGNILGLNLRARAGSLSSSAGSGTTSPSASQSSGDICISPIHQQHLHLHQQQQNLQLQQYQQNLMQNGLTKSILNSVNGSCVAASNGVGVVGTNALLTAATKQQQQMQHQQPPTIIGNGNNNTGLKHLNIFDQQHLVQQQKNKEVELYSERVRSTSGCNGIFSRRLDFSSFNLLPKTRLNSYQVKIEDEGNHGNDETRLFILSSLAQSQMSRVACILCEEPMLVFDRYPLVDGSFFLSPRQHSAGCIEVKYDGRALYLTCVCMTCLDGTASNRIISCRFCGELWDGSNLVLGTMYAYDIFAAMPCCAERLKCNNCFKLLLHPQQRLNFYSDYSHCVTCPYCATQDTHFVKPLSYCYTKSNAPRLQQIA